MNKKYIALCLCLVLVLVQVGCARGQESTDDKPLVYTSFYPIYDMTSQIANDLVEVRSFMPTSASVHDWEPSPKDIRDLSQADLLIVNGANMEKWTTSISQALPELKIVTLSDNVDLITYKGAAVLGEFQLLQEMSLEEGKSYPLVFGHTHEEFMRMVMIKDTGDMSTKDLIQKGRQLMEDEGDLVMQGEEILIDPGQVYKIEMGHQSGQINYKVPESGKWYIFTDRLDEEILSFNFLNSDGEDSLDKEVIMEGSSTHTDQITYDPHSWLSIGNAKSYMATIARELSELCPQYERQFSKNRFKLVDELTTLENTYKQKFKDLDDKEFIVTHYAFEYLARDFGLIQYPLQGLTSMEDPSIRSMVRSIDYAKDQDIKTIFYEYGTPSTIAKVIAEELEDGYVMPLSSMEYPLPGRSIDDMSYYDLMEMNLENLYEVMAGDKA